MRNKFFSIALASFLLLSSSAYIIDHPPNKKHHDHPETISSVNPPNPKFDDKHILHLHTEDFLKITDTYMEMLVLFIKNKEDPESQRYEKFLQALLPWRLHHPSRGIIRVHVKDLEGLPTKFRPNEFPSLVFFMEKRKVIYQGDLDDQKCLSWLEKITSKEIVTLKAQEDLDSFLSIDHSSKIVAFYHSKMLEEEKILKSLHEEGVLLELGIYKVGFCFEDCLASPANEEIQRPSLVLFRDLPGLPTIAQFKEKLNSDFEVTQFINKETMPTLQMLDEDSARFLFLGFAPYHLILIQNPLSSDLAPVEEFRKSAEYNRKEESYSERIVHSLYVIDQRFSGLNELLGIKAQAPLSELLMINVSDSGFAKYRLTEGQITFENIRSFIKDFQQHSLEKFFLSEPIPSEREKGPLEKLVGFNLKSKTRDSKDNYAVLFCENMEFFDCQYAFKIFEHIAEVYHARAPSDVVQSVKLKFAYINTEKNEFELEIKSKYPVIMLFLTEDKEKPREFGALFTIEKVCDWLNKFVPGFDLEIGRRNIEKFKHDKLNSKEVEIYERAIQVDREEIKSKVESVKMDKKVIDIDL